jgi:translation elongation factor EF-1alpha
MATRERAGREATMSEEKVGIVKDYFAKIGVAGIDITGNLKVGDTIHVKGHTTDFEQVVESMQIEHQQVEAAKPGDAVGIKVNERCRDGDSVYKVTP